MNKSVEQTQIVPSVVQGVPRSRFKRFAQVAGSFYVLTFICAMCAMLVFVWLADEVLEKEFASFNSGVLLWIHARSSPTRETIAFAFTRLGSVVGITLLTIIFGCYLWYRKKLIDVAVLLTVILGGAIISTGLKLYFHQVRPHVFSPLAVETNFSFPSGHSLLSFSYFGFWAAWLIRRRPKEIWRWCVGTLALLVAALVALSRLYLGVHWPTDVVAGMLLAVFWVTTCLVGERWMIHRFERRRNRRGEHSGRIHHA